MVPVFKKFIHFLLKLFFIPFWSLEKHFKRDKNLWIFGCWFGQKYSDNTRLFFEYMNKKHPEVKTVWLSKNPAVLKRLKDAGYEACSSNSLKGIRYCLKAGALFSTSGSEVMDMFCNGVTHFSLWHGMPLKMILRDDDKSRIADKEPFFNTLYKKVLKKMSILEYYDDLYTLTSSDFFVPYLSTAFGIPENRILPTGLPRLDAYNNNNKEPLIEKIRKDFPECRIVLYMPTFRTSAWTKEIFNPFDSKFQFEEDAFMKSLEETNTVFLYKPHFCDSELLESKKRNKRFITITDEDYDEMYNFVGQTDILMTDYSSIYFDYIPLKKPVILTPFDYEEYLKTSRNMYFDYKLMEGYNCNNWNDVYETLKNKDLKPVSEESIERFASYVKGNSSEVLYNKVKEIL